MKKWLIIIGIVLPVIVAGILIGPKVVRKLTSIASVTGMSVAKLSLGEYPQIDEADLNDTQKNIIRLTKQEHAAQPDYVKYSQGVREAWCADFASWIMKESGAPYRNPNSGSWRIPGTLTLRDYYEQENRFEPVGGGYVPKIGDVILYDGPGWYGQHVNFVLEVNGDKVTTVGGNEVGKIRVQTRKLGDKGAVGYGLLERRS